MIKVKKDSKKNKQKNSIASNNYMKYFFTLILMIVLNKTSFSQSDWSNDKFSGELKGMSFDYEIKYKIDCTLGTPFVRATLHSVRVTGYDEYSTAYNGLKGYYFPIEVDAGFLEVESEIFTCCIKKGTFQLNKAHLSISNGGEGAALTADEFRFTDESELKKLFNISSCSDLKNKLQDQSITLKVTRNEFQKFEGDLRYQGESLNLLLDAAIKKQSEEFLKPLYQYTKCSATSNNNSIDFYKQGIKKVEGLIRSSTSSLVKEKLNIILKNITNCLNQKIKIQENKDKLDAELKLEKNKRKIQKMRLNREELARINQQLDYNNKVNSYTSKGINLSKAHKMVQEEYKINLIDNVVGKGLNQISNTIMNQINRASARKEARQDANVNNWKSYNDGFIKYINEIRKFNSERRKEIRSLAIYNSHSENVEDLMQEILWLIEAENTESYIFNYKVDKQQKVPSYLQSLHKSEYAMFTVLEKSVVVDKIIEDAYFENNILYVKIKETAKEAQYDKDHLEGYGGGSLGKYQPKKFTLRTLIKYNLDTDETTTFRNCTWVGYGGIPGDNKYVSNESFQIQLKNLDDLKVLIPSKRILESKYAMSGIISTKLNNIRKIYKREEIDVLKSNPSFIKEFEQKIYKQLQDFSKLKSVGGEPNLLVNYRYTTNPNEQCMISFWGDKWMGEENYMLLSYPGGDIMNQVNANNLNFNAPTFSNEQVAKQKLKGNQYGFSKTLDNTSIIGGLNGYAIATLEKYKDFYETIYFYNKAGRNIKDLKLPTSLESNIWMPYIEVGRAEKFIEYEYIENEGLKLKLKEKGVKELPMSEYRVKDADGIIYNLTSKRKILLFPSAKVSYVFSSQDELIETNSNKKQLYNIYTPTKTERYINQKYYAGTTSYISLNQIKKFDVFKSANPIYYSTTFLDGNLSKSETSKLNDVVGSHFSKMGSSNIYYKMFEYFNSIDLSENGITYEGRKPSYDSNGKLETVGISIDGKKVGWWDYYNQAGKIYEKIEYIAGVKVEKIVFDENEIAIIRQQFYSSGILSMSYHYNPITKIRTRKLYDEGIVTSEIDSEAKGIYDEDGKRIESREYEYGILTNTTKL